ncbi:hypothetical protein AB0M45_21735 [Nocardia sp. NPDC051787]|uniref:hypothetical protein n=1 Tax=Nocardia sp. NPDC051787 TaxID=3155415 RepID=UPI0034180EA3
MTGELNVDPDEVRAVGKRLQRVGHDMISIAERFLADTAAYDWVWGEDKYSKQIEYGDNGYRPSRESLADVDRSRGELTVEYGTGLEDSASALEQTEADNAELFR